MVSERNLHGKTDFDPFESRLCRNIRNELSKSLMETLQGGNMGPSYAVAEKYLSESAEPSIAGYINNRITRYMEVFYRIRSANLQLRDTYAIAVLLWDQELFFEVHEWLEKKWLDSSGENKEILQALIRAAGVYLHLEYGRNEAAEKLAAKAVAALLRLKEPVSGFLNVDLLIDRLEALSPVPPKLDAARLTTKIP